jgi:hypothetical protein
VHPLAGIPEAKGPGAVPRAAGASDQRKSLHKLTSRQTRRVGRKADWSVELTVGPQE